MRCEGDRCAALVGDVGVSTSCAIYAVRPDVCRACLPGGDDCAIARRRFNLGDLHQLPATDWTASRMMSTTGPGAVTIGV
jgi:uncharacterized protein